MFKALFKKAGDGLNVVPPPTPPNYGQESHAPVRALILTGALAAGGIFQLFQLGLLPKSWCPWVSKLYFWPTLPFTMLKRHRNYWTKMDETVYLGAAPVGFLGHADDLYARGVRGVINTCGEYRGPLADYEHFGIEQLWLPTLDHQEPELQDYERGVAFIKRWHAKGGKVLVHCKAGHGRSSAIVMGWLLASDPTTTPLEVQRQMLSKRRVRKYLYKQKNLRTFYRALQTAGDGTGKDRDTVTR